MEMNGSDLLSFSLCPGKSLLDKSWRASEYEAGFIVTQRPCLLHNRLKYDRNAKYCYSGSPSGLNLMTIGWKRLTLTAKFGLIISEPKTSVPGMLQTSLHHMTQITETGYEKPLFLTLSLICKRIL